jgi:hypothetical protein
VRQAAARATSTLLAMVALAMVALGLLPAGAGAQREGDDRPRARWEARVDYLGAPDASEAGLGVAARASTYLRFAAIVGADVYDHRTARLDLVGRYLLDPFFEHEWAPYIGGGGSLRFVSGAADDDAWRPFLLLALGMEGPLRGGWTPAVEIGLGGGVRVGLVLRLGSAAGR